MADNPVKAAKKVFFDRPLVIAAIGRKCASVLARSGGFARTVMRRGMRRRKGISSVGAYPNAHENALLKELIFFGYDPSQKFGVHIGPVLITPDSTIVSGTRIVPKLINEGGLIQRRVTSFRRVKGQRVRAAVSRVVKQHYRPRPFVALTAPFAAKALADNMDKMELK